MINELLLIPGYHTTLSTLVFCLIHTQKTKSYHYHREHFRIGGSSGQRHPAEVHQ
jgi:hypothetical protein